jgi:hypothetical protein
MLRLHFGRPVPNGGGLTLCEAANNKAGAEADFGQAPDNETKNWMNE